MLVLLSFLGVLVAFWMYRIATVVHAVNVRQRLVLAGSSAPPVFPSFRRRVAVPVPLRVAAGTAAGRCGADL